MEASQLNDFGYFVGTIECQRDPHNPGQFLLPRNATFVKKPSDRHNFFDFSTMQWKIKEDFEFLPPPPENSIQLTVKGIPSKEEIKKTILELLSML